jgi:hypothetical protein
MKFKMIPEFSGEFMLFVMAEAIFAETFQEEFFIFMTKVKGIRV